MLLLKSLHLVFMVTWFAGLFYLPRLFVYHAMCEDEPGNTRFKVMERKLYYGITMPGAVLTVFFGSWLLISTWDLYGDQLWMHIKLGLVLLLILYHVYCGILVKQFRDDRNTRSHTWYRWFNEVPVVFLIAIVFLAVYRPV